MEYSTYVQLYSIILLYTYYPKYAVRPTGRETRHLGSAFRNGSTECNILEAKMMPDVILAADDQMQFLRGAPNRGHVNTGLRDDVFSIR